MTEKENQVHAEIVSLEAGNTIQKAAESSQQIHQKTWNYDQVIKPRYDFDKLISYSELNTWHNSCLNLWTAVTVDLGWSLVTEEEDKEPDDDYRRITEFFTETGFPDDPFEEVMHRFAYDYFALGNAFQEQALAHGEGQPGEFFHVPGHTVRRMNPKKVNQHKIDRERGYQQKRGIETSDEFLLPDQAGPGENAMWHYLRYDPRDDWYGLPRWIPAIGAISLDRSALEFNIHLFQNEMTGKIIITVTGGELAKGTMDNIKKFVKNNLLGVENAGRTLVLKTQAENAKIEVHHLWKEIQKAKDLSYHQGRQDNRDEIIAAHNVPPRMLGVMSASQLGGTGEVTGQLQLFKELYVEPEQTRLERWFTRGPYKPVFDGTKWRLQFTRMDIADWSEEAGAWRGLVGTEPIAERDEAREALGLAVENSNGAIKQVGDALTIKGAEGIYRFLKSLNNYLEPA